MAKVRGIVAKIEGKKCILLTPSGEFVRTHRAPHSVKLGQEIELARDSIPWYRIVAVAAAVLLIGLILPLYPLLTASAQPIAYLSVDINPSLELGVNKDGKVVQIKSFNQAGSALTNAAAIKNEGIYQAMQALISQALKQGFIAQDKPNLIVAVYTDNARFQFDKGKIQAAVQQEVVSAGLAADLVITATDMETHRQAAADQISQGKYFVLNAMKARGKDISVENMRQDGINQALASQGLNIADVAPVVTQLNPGGKAGGMGPGGDRSKDKGMQGPEMKGNAAPQTENGEGKGRQEKPHKPGMQKEKRDGGKGETSQEMGQTMTQNPLALTTSQSSMSGQQSESTDSDQESKVQGER